jgi:hypothetical protein
MDAQKIVTPTPIATEAFSSVDAAIVRLEEIYERNTAFLRQRFEAYANGERVPHTPSCELLLIPMRDLTPDFHTDSSPVQAFTRPH